jgi:hypothetical protein
MLKRKRYLKINDCSVSNLSNQIKCEIPYLVSKYSSKQSFIPFLRERDSLGKIIEKSEFPVLKTRSQPRLRKPKKPRLSSPRLLKKTHFETPAVGTYETRQPWIKSSFSHKKPVFSPVSKNPESPSKKRGKEIIFKKPFEYRLPRTESLPERPKGIWESFQLFGTPEHMKRVFNFKRDLKQVLEYQLEIAKGLEKLREINSDNVLEKS